MKITSEYLELNRELHHTNMAYGTSGGKWGGVVLELCREHECWSVLDYGCGKQTLATSLSNPIWLTGYDPCIEGLDERPEPHDLVVVGDVMEHIEPECLDDVLEDIALLTNKVALFVIATRAAVKNLPDGRNAHLIVEPLDWWKQRLGEHFEFTKDVDEREGEFICVMTPKRESDE